MSTGTREPIRKDDASQDELYKRVRDIFGDGKFSPHVESLPTRSEKFHDWLYEGKQAVLWSLGILGALVACWPLFAENFGWPLSNPMINAWLLGTFPWISGASGYLALFVRAIPWAGFLFVAFFVDESPRHTFVEYTSGGKLGIFAGSFFAALIATLTLPMCALVAVYGVAGLVEWTLQLGAAKFTGAGLGLSSAWQWGNAHLGLVLGVVAGVVALLVILLGWLFWESEPGDKGHDPVAEFFTSLGGAAKTLAIPAAGAALIGYFGGMGWFSPVLQWCWGWWSWPPPESIPERIIIDLACGIVSIAATLALFIWTFFAGLGWFGYKAIVLASAGWWRLATGTSVDPLFAAAIALGAVFLAHRALKSSFGVNPVLLMTKRTAIRFGHGFDALVVMLSPSRPTHAKKEDSMRHDDCADDPEIKNEWRKVEPFARLVHEEMPDAGPLPTMPSEYRGFFELAIERAKVRGLTRLDRRKVEWLKTINDGLEQVERCEKKADEIIRFRSAAKTRDLQARFAHRQVEVNLKGLDRDEAKIDAEIADLKKPKTEKTDNREPEDFARHMFDAAKDLAQVAEAEQTLVTERPDQAEDIRSMADRYRQKILLRKA